MQKSFKTILLGDSGVGKTSLFVRLTQDHFPLSAPGGKPPQATLQMDIGRKVFKIYPTIGNQRSPKDSPYKDEDLLLDSAQSSTPPTNINLKQQRNSGLPTQ